MSNQIEIIILAIIVASACAIPGVFLVLRKMSMMSDAISHSILFGIVIAFFIVKTLNSPFLFIAAVLTGVLTAVLTELINKTRLLKEDSSIGLVFPLLFSIGVILISKYTGNIHIDSDVVLMGEIAFAPFERFEIFGFDLGPESTWVMLGILLLNLSFIIVFFKELKLSTFDPGLAMALGFSPAFFHYAIMVLISITAVGAFDVVGSILVVAFMIVSPATAYLLTDHLAWMTVLSVIVGMISSIFGTLLAFTLDTSIAGTMASVLGLIFIAALIFAPKSGAFFKFLQRKRQKILFASHMLAVHLFYHEGTDEESSENTVQNMRTHMKWNAGFCQKIIASSIDKGLVLRQGDQLRLTNLGRETAKTVMNQT